MSDKNNYSEIPPQDYFSFIIKNLTNPQQVWADEYENKIDNVDRLLLTTIYSLTSTTVSFDTVKRCFEFRLQKHKDIDLSVNQFDNSLKRLEKLLVKIVDSKGRRMLSIANPSINDFLDAYLGENIPEKNDIINNSCSVMQLKRMLPKENFEANLQALFESHDILKYYFVDAAQLRGFITYYIATHNVEDEVYLSIIQEYVLSLCDLDMGEGWKIYCEYILCQLQKKELIEFYQLKGLLVDETWLNKFLDIFQLEDLVTIINLIEYLYEGEIRKLFCGLAEEAIKEKVEWYCADVPAGNYNIDIDEVIRNYTQAGLKWDKYDIESDIEQEISEWVLDEVGEYLAKLPTDIKINEEFISGVVISISGVSQMVDNYFDDIDYDPELLYDRNVDDVDDIDLIFNR